MLSFRKIIFNPSLMFGHNWDYSFPEVSELGSNIINLSIYSWNNFTGDNALLTSHFFHNSIYYILSYYFSPSIVMRIILLSCVIISFIGMIKFSTQIIGELNNNYTLRIVYTTAILYALSPYFYSILIGGSWYAWLSYSVTPFYLFYIISYLTKDDNNETKSLLLILLSLTILLGFIQYFLIVNIILFAILFKNNKIKYNNLLKIIIFCSFVNAYFWLPFLVGFFEFYNNTINNLNSYNNFESVRSSTQNIYSIITGTGFLNRNFYIESLNSPFNIFYNISALIVFYIIIFPILQKKIFNYEYFKIILLLLLFIIIVKGGNSPFSDFSMSLYDNFPLLRIYRSPQNIFFSITLILAVTLLISLSIQNEVKYFKIIRPIYLFILIIPVYLSGWIINGDIGTDVLTKKNMSSISHYEVSPNLKKMLLNSENIDDNTFELFIPLATSINFILDSKENYKHQGGEPNYPYMSNVSPVLRYVNQAISDEILYNKVNLIKFIRRNGIGYITIRKDIKSHFFKDNKIDYKKLEQILNQIGHLDSETNIYKRYKVSKKYKNNIISICKQSDFDDICESIYSTSDLVDKETPQINITKLSPVKYKVTLTELPKSGKIYLRFSIYYSKYWSILSLNEKSYFKRLYDYLNYDMELFQHIKLKSEPYDVNGWIINLDNLSTELSDLNKDNGNTIEFYIYYSKQIIYEIGYIFSLISLIVFFSIQVLLKYQRKNTYNA